MPLESASHAYDAQPLQRSHSQRAAVDPKAGDSTMTAWRFAIAKRAKRHSRSFEFLRRVFSGSNRNANTHDLAEGRIPTRITLQKSS